MNDRLAAAQAALNAGRKDEAIELLKSAIDDNPAQPAGAYRVLSVQLYQANRFDEGDVYSAIGVAQHPREFDLLNTRGVILRKLKRYPEAAAVLERAIKVNPKNTAAPSNLGNVLLDMGAAARAEQYFAKLARQDPRNAEVQRQLGRTLQKQGKREAALVRFRSAVALKKDFIDAWLDMVGDLNDKNLSQEAEALCERALEANPGNERLLEAKAIVVRRAGQARRAEAYLLELVPSLPDAAWLQYQLGTSISDYDRDRANVHMRRAVELAPDNLDYLMALIESLERTRAGDEGANIEESARLAHRALARKAEFTPVHLKVMQEVLVRVCAFEDMAELGDPGTIARALAESGRHTALLKQLPQIRTDADRLSILEAHRIWGRDVERKAAEQPIVRPPPRAAGGKIRLGFMSSDLRRHPVGYFTEPLFEHLDHERFEVFIYSYNQGEKDAMQDWITQKVTAYRWWPDISSRDAAQAIANDELDLLVELGGSTHMNKLDVMAYRPAARQASWLGYPHSSGLSTIDYLSIPT